MLVGSISYSFDFINLENDETISDEWEPVKTDKKVSLEKQKLVEAQAKQFLAKANVKFEVKPIPNRVLLDKTAENCTIPCLSKIQ